MAENWQVVPFKKAKPVEGGGWDQSAARRHAAEKASSDGSGEKDTINWTEYRQFFGLYDAADPENIGSYKYPLKDVRDGVIVLVFEGLSAAMARLGSAPAQVRRRLYNLLKRYYSLFEGKEVPEYKFARLSGVEILRPGRWNGFEVSREDCQRLVDGYDPSYLLAPVLLGHKMEYGDGDEKLSEGWVERLYWKDGAVAADLADVPDSTAELVQQGRLHYPSVYVSPDFNELYHLALLGGSNPAVEGLATLRDAVVQFSGDKDVRVITMDSNKEGKTPMPDMDEKEKLTLFQRFGRLLGFTVQPAADGGVSVSSDEEALEFKRRAEAAETRLKELEGRVAEQERQARFARAEAEVDRLVAEGRLTPAVKDAGLTEVVAFLSRGEKLKFKKGDEEVEGTYGDRLLFALSQLPQNRLKKLAAAPDAGEGSLLGRSDAIDQEMEKQRLEFSRKHGREPDQKEELQLYEMAVNTVDGRKS